MTNVVSEVKRNDRLMVDPEAIARIENLPPGVAAELARDEKGEYSIATDRTTVRAIMKVIAQK